MKKILTLLIILTALAGCKEKSTEASIKGTIRGLGNDTILIYGADEFSDFTDSIPVINDNFEYSMPADTLMQVMLSFSNEWESPVFVDKSNKITITGDADAPSLLQITGNNANDDLTNFYQRFAPMAGLSKDSIEVFIENYIRQNQTSPINIYLVDKYFIQQSKPNIAKIKEVMALMTGELQDKPYMEKIAKFIKEAEESEVGKNPVSFNLNNKDGKRVSRTDYRTKYLLITFWASWNDSCRNYNAELRGIQKKYKKKEDFAMLGISLDMDKEQWKQSLKQDTLTWEQVCDFAGWESPVVKQFAVRSLPCNILLSPQGKVVERDINGEELKNKLQEILGTD